MSKKDLKYFMRAAEPEIVKAKGPESFRDENGNIIDFEIKALTQAEIQKINDLYRERRIATDKRGNPLVQNGEVVFRVERDNAKATRHIMAEALVYPNLKDEELMKYYNCVDVTEMPLLVFSRPDEFQYVMRIVMSALGIGDFDEDGGDSEVVAEAKN